MCPALHATSPNLATLSCIRQQYLAACASKIGTKNVLVLLGLIALIPFGAAPTAYTQSTDDGT